MARIEQTTPRGFRIWVDGRLSRGFVDGLEGIDQHDSEGSTILSGNYIDESHLEGVLDQLRRLAIGIQRFEVDPAPRRPRATTSASREDVQ